MTKFIELKLQGFNATITLLGGVIETFSKEGEDIFFPRQEIDGKQRGGCHVCVPYFGPGQPQHGYGRAIEWVVESQAVDKVVLQHQQLIGEYAGLAMELRYTLMPDGLLMELHLDNGSDRPLRVAPGFHPYFALKEGIRELQFNAKTYQIAQLAGTEFVTSESATARAGMGRINYDIASDELKAYALWSAHPEKYVCVEPTLAGNSFHNNPDVPDNEWLQPDEKRAYIVRILPL